jgi:hypothetical protein
MMMMMMMMIICLVIKALLKDRRGKDDKAVPSVDNYYPRTLTQSAGIEMTVPRSAKFVLLVSSASAGRDFAKIQSCFAYEQSVLQTQQTRFAGKQGL